MSHLPNHKWFYTLCVYWGGERRYKWYRQLNIICSLVSESVTTLHMFAHPTHCRGTALWESSLPGFYLHPRQGRSDGGLIMSKAAGTRASNLAIFLLISGITCDMEGLLKEIRLICLPFDLFIQLGLGSPPKVYNRWHLDNADMFVQHMIYVVQNGSKTHVPSTVLVSNFLEIPSIPTAVALLQPTSHTQFLPKRCFELWASHQYMDFYILRLPLFVLFTVQSFINLLVTFA